MMRHRDRHPATAPSRIPGRLTILLRRFRRSEAGTSTFEFMILFPVVWMMFGLTMESGMYSMQQVMLERGLDLTVRDVRLGVMDNPTRETLIAQTCAYALILNNCESSLRMEMIPADVRSWTAIPREVPCIDRSEVGIPVMNITNGDNNDLMVLRACVLIKPLLPLAEFGRTLVESNDKSNDEYALSVTSSYVMEPFK
ncbi:TadE/TadG family type IV pilus assembly protein [Loktanella sp. M215]|uniref:TadE/TadG family type IV pilus assembly protein n=1 Tax=Loktanella sp. M215 TaxID=2675431 RepID=UPI001F3F3EF6|nr:pilus assembly protein [Loktanella sp. M215]MCF7700875.1 pilus assembly protein [Loktanella sp. M215]